MTRSKEITRLRNVIKLLTEINQSKYKKTIELMKKEIELLQSIEPDTDAIIEQVTNYWGCDSIIGGAGHECANARYAVAVILKLKYEWTTSRIGRLLNIHHSTVIYGLRTFADQLKVDEHFFDFVFDLVMEYELKFTDIYKLAK